METNHKKKLDAFVHGREWIDLLEYLYDILPEMDITPTEENPYHEEIDLIVDITDHVHNTLCREDVIYKDLRPRSNDELEDVRTLLEVLRQHDKTVRLYFQRRLDAGRYDEVEYTFEKFKENFDRRNFPIEVGGIYPALPKTGWLKSLIDSESIKAHVIRDIIDVYDWCIRNYDIPGLLPYQSRILEMPMKELNTQLHTLSRRLQDIQNDETTVMWSSSSPASIEALYHALGKSISGDIETFEMAFTGQSSDKINHKNYIVWEGINGKSSQKSLCCLFWQLYYDNFIEGEYADGRMQFTIKTMFRYRDRDGDITPIRIRRDNPAKAVQPWLDDLIKNLKSG